MHFHPDITQQAARQRFAELLEDARRERLAAIVDSRPDLGERVTRVSGAVSGIQLRLERRPVAGRRPGLGTA